jgi:arginyl-tRNA synthetase
MEFCFGIDEKVLLKKVASLAEILETITINYQTHLLAYYTIELSTAFHAYYTQYKIIDFDNKRLTQSRLQLIIIVKNTLTLCFDLLGIAKPDIM